MKIKQITKRIDLERKEELRELFSDLVYELVWGDYSVLVSILDNLT